MPRDYSLPSHVLLLREASRKSSTPNPTPPACSAGLPAPGGRGCAGPARPLASMLLPPTVSPYISYAFGILQVFYQHFLAERSPYMPDWKSLHTAVSPEKGAKGGAFGAPLGGFTEGKLQ